MTRMLTSTLALLAIFAASPASEYAVAHAHRQTLGADAYPYAYYFTTSGVQDERQRANLVTAMQFILPSLSMKPIIDHQIPQQLEGTNLYYIDTRNFGWQKSLPKLLVKHYPYGIYGPHTLVIRADWFLPFATDASETGAYYDLLFGFRPKTRDEFLKLLQVSNDRQFAFGLIEGESGVAVQQIRHIESRPMPRGSIWFTLDSEKISGDSDPLAHPDGNIKHDAEEWIYSIYKICIATGVRGHLQGYFLANGQGKTQDVAPTRIVTDTTGVRYGSKEIRNGVSCIACHTPGLNPPTVNEFRQLIEGGTDVYAKKNDQEQLEAFHLSNIGKEIDRHNEDFNDIIEECTGGSSEHAVACFVERVKGYDARLTLQQAAWEHGCEAKELQLALAYASQYGDFSPRLAGLGDGKPMLRHTWEDGDYLRAYTALRSWRKKQ